ncbi:hypothetical protein [Teredinibacter purpureus]|uniref:hypothetical protein n=1 Tax=Teredinibacter purpureus TaxID=2731756 RepID=UPI0005F82512|nr:hypothetical protein [Teredinibacter purpureus]
MTTRTQLIQLISELNIEECNGTFQLLVCERAQHYCALKNKPIGELTLNETLSIISAATTEFNNNTQLANKLMHNFLQQEKTNRN